jgi:WD40 repeat protein
LRLISASKDGTLRVWDCDSGRLALTLRDHAGPVTGVAIGGVDMRVVSTSYDGTLLIRRARAH